MDDLVKGYGFTKAQDSDVWDRWTLHMPSISMGMTIFDVTCASCESGRSMTMCPLALFKFNGL